jgi:hypothetical protein
MNVTPSGVRRKRLTAEPVRSDSTSALPLLDSTDEIFVIACEIDHYSTADKIVCRTSNVDITARSCELTFKIAKHTLKGREANEVFATLVMAGVLSDGAAGSIVESLSKLNCTLDPKAKEKAGGGADCSFDAGN